MTPTSKVLCLIICFFQTSTVLAQADLNPPAVVPPSPTAASLGKYGETPVNLYTGSPQISIPLYTLSYRDLDLPISLSYNSSGIKVEEMASWVGLGWSLSAGGVITRAIRGKTDEDVTFGYFAQKDIVEPIAGNPNRSSWTMADMDVLIDVASGKRDITPDIFYFNFMGYSGSFIYELNGTQRIPRFSPHSNLKIEEIFGANEFLGFEITAEDGTRFVFGEADGRSATEFTETETICNNIYYGSGSPPPPTESSFSFGSNTSWYLMKVISPANAEINFYYKDYDLQYTSYNASESITYEKVFGGLYNTSSCYAINIINGKHLDSITTDNSTIIFNSTNDREDLQPLGLSGDFKLNEIVIKNEFNQFVRKFSFDYSYYNPSLTFLDKRLRLDAVQEENEIGQTTPPYSFTYNTDHLLPPRDSKAQDHWGYYNGKLGNNSMAPNYVKNTLYNDGGDRSPDASYLKAGTLEEIAYPTGGKTTFEFEANLVTRGGNFVLDECALSAGCDVNYACVNTGNDPVCSVNQTQSNFTILERQQVVLTLHFDVSAMTDPPDACAEYFYQFTDSNNENVRVYDATGNTISSLSCSGVTETKTYLATLDPGTYSLTANGFDLGIEGVVSSLNIAYMTDVPGVPFLIQDVTSGLRVKTITDYDGNDHSNDIMRSFDYSQFDNSLRSSGKLISRPNYLSVYDSPNGGSFETRSSNSYINLGTTQGSHIGYPQITELVGESGENGKSQYTYSYFDDTNYGGLIWLPFLPKTSYDWRRGNLLTKSDFNANGDTLARIENTYNFDETLNEHKEAWYVVADLAAIQHATGTIQTLHTRFEIGFAENISKWVYMQSSTQRTYDQNNPGRVVSVKTDYFYDNPDHIQLTRQATADSQNKVVETQLSYPEDYPQGSRDAVIQAMIDKHQVATVIEQRQSVADKVISASATGFQYDAINDIIQPQSINMLSTDVLITDYTPSIDGVTFDPRMENRATYYQYDNKGNVLEFSKEDDVHTVYLWGYNQAYPVAQVVNATYSEVTGALAPGDLALLRGNTLTDAQIRSKIDLIRQGLPDAQVTCYTYDPLVGMTSSVDPRGILTEYQYDDFNRLFLVKDHLGNIVQKYEYKYDNAGTQ